MGKAVGKATERGGLGRMSFGWFLRLCESSAVWRITRRRAPISGTMPATAGWFPIPCRRGPASGASARNSPTEVRTSTSQIKLFPGYVPYRTAVCADESNVCNETANSGPPTAVSSGERVVSRFEPASYDDAVRTLHRPQTGNI
ncbi:hypothetical protein DAPPUDRAFT_114446 [Daphnia pulex]|uniref:Uncharacterized protein n=1 Tax=Daphnia pulex TaxID=6669 RepID=E9HI60_DAPPU|nr:hypothetical protein DAPPUDRAFT_114446 [Daphnia pulex]|eukprot:EFX68570.1 hypothetical protein DAPPUDRAFT_114446 [Daphnia pulex]